MASSTTKGTRPGQPSEEGVIEFMKQGAHEKKLGNRQHLAVGMTWLTEEPALVKPQDLLQQIEKYSYKQKRPIKSIVLMVTPSLAHFLDPDTLLKPVLAKLFQSVTATTGEKPRIDFSTAAAVVDALPVAWNKESRPKHQNGQGLALLMTSDVFASARKASTNEGNDGPAIIEFVSWDGNSYLTDSSRSTSRHISLPVANTLFLNGQRDTMLHHVWDIHPGDSGPKIQLRDTSRARLLRVPLPFHPDSFLRGHIPLRGLTPERPVSRCMGNVLAEIEIDGKSVPASQELEETVTKHVASEQSGGPVLVYALIRPPGMRPATVEAKDVAKRKSDYRFLLEIWRGARLHKVTGGGGGWGKKKGLLSLDTAVDSKAGEAQTMLLPDLDDDDGSTPFEMKSQAMIPEGSTIEFLIHVKRPPPMVHVSNPENRPSWDKSMARKWVFGSASPTEHPERPAGKESNHHDFPEVKFFPDFFGMLSYGNVYLGSDETATPAERYIPDSPPLRAFRSRLDVPDSSLIFTTSAAPPERKLIPFRKVKIS
ncbi:hypothetical protein LTR99_003926 [Exophiala xenobiotica]|uniref:Uncharacterized protein n=1 Tax=Vermiconidia calcicola TaxID=1690605 RepID=A0AAV9PZ60_9PEZI|nr:hypothetical protein LTR92_009757 [Exophiala xenobiotica]KAK5529755.1 hypothetical protein LTR25_009534 [Vermiconidia calcicola]KAK5549040.1 hypothetical protein LTR23_000870 [Chaetothyriales sp. CCFEE 6169]KAK5220191.1 hypothetical protein LTR72_007722 [Exophiala xenobiotica]KAK5233152.1 hypothetical protein LTR47_005649 [Exophiala xenobiotica]